MVAHSLGISFLVIVSNGERDMRSGSAAKAAAHMSQRDREGIQGTQQDVKRSRRPRAQKCTLCSVSMGGTNES